MGNYLYVVGGYTGSTYLTSVERATINSDGTISTFASVSGVTLATARSLHSCSIVGNFVYAIGGQTTGDGYVNSVERASLNEDGTIGTFATVSGVTLTAAKRSFAASVVGVSMPTPR